MDILKSNHSKYSAMLACIQSGTIAVVNMASYCLVATTNTSNTDTSPAIVVKHAGAMRTLPLAISVSCID